MFASGKYGVEYDLNQRKDNPSGLKWVLVAIAAIALVSLTWTIIRRVRSASADERLHQEAVAKPDRDGVPSPSAAGGGTPAPPMSRGFETSSQVRVVPKPPPAPTPTEPPPERIVPPSEIMQRPVKLRNLLLRLDEARASRSLELECSTIEQIRAMPGSPAADIDDKLARRLGELNVRRLFVRHNAQWVKSVTVKRGDVATRIAAEHGSTFASFKRLNGADADRLRAGSKVLVMNHPRFNLVIHRRSRTADLSLNGKFFKRYDVVKPVSGKTGAYSVANGFRAFWKSLGVEFSPDDRGEIETLMPVGSPVLVSEM